jgi:hypothetical protein
MSFEITPKMAHTYGKRGAKANERPYRIDGLYVSAGDIAKHTGLTTRDVRKRLAKLRGASGAITMERIKAA